MLSYRSHLVSRGVQNYMNEFFPGCDHVASAELHGWAPLNGGYRPRTTGVKSAATSTINGRRNVSETLMDTLYLRMVSSLPFVDALKAALFEQLHAASTPGGKEVERAHRHFHIK